MKKVLAVLLCAMSASLVLADGKKLAFAYEAGAELTTAYLWRGSYNGGLSLQPEVLIGWDSPHTSFRVGAWASIGASDWTFRKETNEASGTFFVPEVDILASLQIYGLTLGATHYYYGDKSFFNWGKDVEVAMEEHDSQTEVQIGYDFGAMTAAGLYVNWYTIVAGADAYQVEETGEYKRAYSSYIELGYSATLPLDIEIDVQVGMTPWRSMYTDYEGGFAVNNVSGRIEVPFELGNVCTLSVFAQGSINTYKMTKENLFVNAAGDDKIGWNQRLNGCLGVGLWF